MSVDIKYPKISSTTERGQFEQIRSYLYQLVDQLNYALNAIGGEETTVLQQGSKATAAEESKKAEATFNSIKALIIKSADIVNAYYEEINERFTGQYVAQSDFGTYMEQTEQSVTANSTAITNMFNSMQKIITEIENLEHSLVEVNAHIKSGLLFYDDAGVPIYGLEIGQKNEIDGVEVFNKYARFTSDRLSFYDKSDVEVAYISDYKLHITNAEITGTLTLGRYVLDTSDGLAIKWI